MVRLVFRPYTQVLRSICTSESLRASIRVSPDFALPKHSSPSFGSQQICSYSNLSSKTHGWSILDYIIRNDIIHTSIYRKDISLLSLRIKSFITLILAYVLDSLVRVSRRVDQNHFVNILKRVTFLNISHYHIYISYN